jgi:hypothetical protein
VDGVFAVAAGRLAGEHVLPGAAGIGRVRPRPAPHAGARSRIQVTARLIDVDVLPIAAGGRPVDDLRGLEHAVAVRVAEAFDLTGGVDAPKIAVRAERQLPQLALAGGDRARAHARRHVVPGRRQRRAPAGIGERRRRSAGATAARSPAAPARRTARPRGAAGARAPAAAAAVARGGPAPTRRARGAHGPRGARGPAAACGSGAAHGAGGARGPRGARGSGAARGSTGARAARAARTRQRRANAGRQENRSENSHRPTSGSGASGNPEGTTLPRHPPGAEQILPRPGKANRRSAQPFFIWAPKLRGPSLLFALLSS